MSNAAKFGIIGIILIIIFGYNLWASKFDRRLKHNHILVCATITNMRAGKGVNVIYNFEMKGVRYEFNKSSPKATLLNYDNGITKILVVVDRENPGNNRILYDESIYDKYDVIPADTIGILCK